MVMLAREKLLKAAGLDMESPDWRMFLVSLIGCAYLFGFMFSAFQALGGVFSEQMVQSLLKTAVLAPIFEEMLFRGLLQQRLAEWSANHLIAITVCAVFFGLAHCNAYSRSTTDFASLLMRIVSGPMMGGFLYGLIRALSGSVVPSIIAHSAYNAIVVVGFADRIQCLYETLRRVFLLYLC